MVFFNKEYKVYDLRQYGLKGLYFDLVSAIDFMCCAVDHGEKILGGDIIILEGKDYIESDNNWYSEEETPEKSLKTAIDYLHRYLIDHPYVDWLVGVITSNNHQSKE